MEEYTKHVQATHFALTLLTFALLVMSIGREPSETEEALRQIKTIHSAVQSWDPRGRSDRGNTTSMAFHNLLSVTAAKSRINSQT